MVGGRVAMRWRSAVGLPVHPFNRWSVGNPARDFAEKLAFGKIFWRTTSPPLDLGEGTDRNLRTDQHLRLVLRQKAARKPAFGISPHRVLAGPEDGRHFGSPVCLRTAAGGSGGSNWPAAAGTTRDQETDSP